MVIFLPSFGLAKTKRTLEAERSVVSLLYKGWHRRWGYCPAGVTIQEELLMEGYLVFSLEPWPLIGSWLLGVIRSPDNWGSHTHKSSCADEESRFSLTKASLH